MKLTKRFLSALMVAAMLIIALPVLSAPATADTTTLTLEESTFERTSLRMGNFVDGRLEFNKNENIRSTLNLAQPLNMAAGDYTARIYMRSPQKIAGAYEFLRFTVKQGNSTVATQNLTGNSFSAYQNKPLVCEINFTLAEDAEVNLTINYYGNFNIIIDRIDFVTAGTPSAAQTVAKEGETTGSVDTYTFTADDLNGVSVIDSFSIARGDTKVIVPASYLNAWFEEGYTEATMTFSNADVALQSRLVSKMNSYDASNYMVTVFDFDVALTDASGKETALTAMPGAINVETLVPQRITSKFNPANRKLCVSYQASENSVKDSGLIGTLSKVDGDIIATTSISNLGTILIAASCLK